MAKSDEREERKALKDEFYKVISNISFSSFHPEATQEFMKASFNYMETLYLYSKRIAERHGSKQVSNFDIIETSHYLTSKHQTLFLDIIQLVGTLLLGFAVPLAVQLAVNIIPYSVKILIFILGSFFSGLVLMSYYYVNR